MQTDNVSRNYTGDAGRNYHESKRAIPTAAFPWVARLRAEKVAPYVTERDVVLEYGVGYGWNLAELKCQRKIGFDVAEFLAPSLRERGIEFVKETGSIQAASIDVVICHHTLEHVLHPAEMLAEMRRLLRTQGKLLLFVPFEKERRYRSFNSTEPNHHLYSWNVQTLGNLLEAMGFTLVEGRVRRFGYDRFAATWSERFHLGEAGFRLLRSAIHILKPACEVRVAAVKTAPAVAAAPAISSTS